MSELELALEECKMAENTSSRYFGYLYTGINITLVFWSTLLVFVFRENIQPLYFQISTFYLLPLITYILGLMYCYNSCVLAKLGVFQIERELTLKQLNLKCNGSRSYSGWVTFAKKHDGGFILAYGTILALYILFPVFCFFIGIINNDSTVHFQYTDNYIWDTCFSYLPFMFYAIYFFLAAKIILNIIKLAKEATGLKDNIVI